ncbi:MAG: DUF421 domain-containing protein [Janthinobacterium lividum]
MTTVLKAAAAYLVVLFAMRLIGRRTASQQAPFDMVVLFLFGGMTTAAILGEDRSFTAAMTGIFTVGLMHVLVGWLKLKSVLIERIVDGTPIVVFEEGRWSEDQMRKLRMQEADIRTAMRQQGMIELDAMRYAVVERDGTISIIPKEDK